MVGRTRRVVVGNKDMMEETLVILRGEGRWRCSDVDGARRMNAAGCVNWTRRGSRYEMDETLRGGRGKANAVKKCIETVQDSADASKRTPDTLRGRRLRGCEEDATRRPRVGRMRIGVVASEYAVRWTR